MGKLAISLLVAACAHGARLEPKQLIKAIGAFGDVVPSVRDAIDSKVRPDETTDALAELDATDMSPGPSVSRSEKLGDVSVTKGKFRRSASRRRLVEYTASRAKAGQESRRRKEAPHSRKKETSGSGKKEAPRGSGKKDTPRDSGKKAARGSAKSPRSAHRSRQAAEAPSLENGKSTKNTKPDGGSAKKGCEGTFCKCTPEGRKVTLKECESAWRGRNCQWDSVDCIDEL